MSRPKLSADEIEARRAQQAAALRDLVLGRSTAKPEAADLSHDRAAPSSTETDGRP